jgi:hypothetical protein
VALSILAAAERLGLPAYLERSGGGGGWHVWVFFDGPVPAKKARALLFALIPSGVMLADGTAADAQNNRGIEVFPKQDECPEGGYGNMVWLPWWHGAAEGGNLFYALNEGELIAYLPDGFATASEEDLDQTIAEVNPNRASASRPTVFEGAAEGRDGRRRVPADLLVRRALNRTDGGRNDNGLWLAIQLRDNRYTRDEAEAIVVEKYLPAVSQDRHPYTEREARATVRSAYTRPPRSPWPDRHGTPAQPMGRIHCTPRTSANGYQADLPNAENSSDPLDQDATALDLIAANAVIRWAWTNWIPIGVLTILASEPGIGKTRFCLDLARRVFGGLPWPDGSPPTFPAGSASLWVAADNQHAELASLPAAFRFLPTALYLNATKRNPFGGTMLDEPADLRDFEARIQRVMPALVFVDTSLNATDRSSHKPEDAKAFFVPLQQIAARCGIVLMCVTHLNAAGKPLGRRIQGQGRVVIQMEHPDPDNQPKRRKLYVVKSHSLYPPPLGVTMGDDGNTYDTTPPEPPNGEETSRSGVKKARARDWLRSHLQGGPRKVTEIRNAAENVQINARYLYLARDELGIEEYTSESRKWWRLRSNDPQ